MTAKYDVKLEVACSQNCGAWPASFCSDTKIDVLNMALRSGWFISTKHSQKKVDTVLCPACYQAVRKTVK